MPEISPEAAVSLGDAQSLQGCVRDRPKIRKLYGAMWLSCASTFKPKSASSGPCCSGGRPSWWAQDIVWVGGPRPEAAGPLAATIGPSGSDWL